MPHQTKNLHHPFKSIEIATRHGTTRVYHSAGSHDLNGRRQFANGMILYIPDPSFSKDREMVVQANESERLSIRLQLLESSNTTFTDLFVHEYAGWGKSTGYNVERHAQRSYVDWGRQISDVFDRLVHERTNRSRIYVVGHRVGALFALGLTQKFCGLIDEVHLLDPGIRTEDLAAATKARQTNLVIPVCGREDTANSGVILSPVSDKAMICFTPYHTDVNHYRTADRCAVRVVRTQHGNGFLSLSDEGLTAVFKDVKTYQAPRESHRAIDLSKAQNYLANLKEGLVRCL